MTNLQNAILEASNNDLISYSEASSMLNTIMEAGKSIIEIINSIDGLKSLKPASSEDIKAAEDELGLKFSSEYVQYTKKFGAISFYGTELTGVGVPKGLNVVNRTKSERNMNESFPSDCYVIENGDEVVVVSDSSGKIYKVAGNQKKMIHPSLSSYIDECISRKAVKESCDFFESSIIEVINSIDKLKTFKPASSEDITSAENELGLKFASDYKEYLSKFGAVIGDGIELTGIAKSAHRDVVKVTKECWDLNEKVPHNMYVIEDSGIDGIVIWQDNSGKVYQSEPSSKPKKIASSLSDYINSHM